MVTPPTPSASTPRSHYLPAALCDVCAPSFPMVLSTCARVLGDSPRIVSIEPGVSDRTYTLASSSSGSIEASPAWSTEAAAAPSSSDSFPRGYRVHMLGDVISSAPYSSRFVLQPRATVVLVQSLTCASPPACAHGENKFTAPHSTVESRSGYSMTGIP